MIVEHIAYNRTEQQYDADIFTKEKNRQPLEKAYDAKKHILDYVFTDSKGERKFAEALDKADEVCVYARLPRTFQIPTPVGKYAPDWAIAFNDNMEYAVYELEGRRNGKDRMCQETLQQCIDQQSTLP